MPIDRVVHKSKSRFDVYIGRGSKWGNPFVIGPDGNREQVIEKYRQYLLYNEKFGKDIPDNKELLAALPELRGKVLGCWCRPKACHGDVLIELLQEQGEA
jgi:hypothetical protein